VRQDFGSLDVRCVTMLLDAIHRSADGAVADSAASVSPVVDPRLVLRDSVSWVTPAPAAAPMSATICPIHSMSTRVPVDDAAPGVAIAMALHGGEHQRAADQQPLAAGQIAEHAKQMSTGFLGIIAQET
jgi:hypothetical protein